MSCAAPDEMAPEPATPVSQAARQPKRVLVIAEDPHIRSLTVALLEANGYTVMAGQDGLDALGLVTQQTPHVVVLIVQLPSRLGLEMLKPLRDRAPRLLPVVLVSADATLVLPAESRHPHLVSEQAIAIHELLPHVDRLLSDA